MPLAAVMVRGKPLSAGFSKFAPSSAALDYTLAMVSSSGTASSLSYADRAKLGKSPSSSQSPTPSYTLTTEVEKSGEDALSSSLLNGLSPPQNAAPNFWAARKEQMAAKVVSAVASSSSSPTLVALPSLPTSAPLRGSRDANGVDLIDASSWPQVTAASTPTKDRSDKTPSKEPTTPTPTPKKGEKTKWVLIPPTELQAAADAVTRGRSSPKHASATTSTHSSPKVSSRGRRLPNEDPPHESRRRSPSRLATHAYTHPLNSPTRPSSSFVLPAPAPHTEPHHPPLTLQKRPPSPARSGPVAGYRDIDDLKLSEGRLVMFGSIGAPLTSGDTSPMQRGLGLDVGGADGDRRRRQETWDVGRRVGGGFAIGIPPEELVRTKLVKATRRKSAPPALALSPEIVDLTDGTWSRDVIGSRSNEDREALQRKWEFGTSRHPTDTISSSPSPLLSQSLQQFSQPHMYAPPPPPPQFGGYPPPLVPPMSVSAPESVVGDPIEYDPRSIAYGEPYPPGIERERRGGYGGPRRGRYAGGRGGPNGNTGRGYGGRRGGGPSQHYGPPPPPPPPPPGAYPPTTPYPPPPPPPGPDGYYMGPQYSLPYPQYAPPPVPSYPVPPVMDAPATMRPAPVPMPVTVTSFPIDPTRWYLLGQVEYYFSVQNLCTDFWLRKQMDNRGWVPISVIASFNRVRQLTYDIALVRDVMSLSALVEVQGDKVRLRERRWEPFILPDAAASDLPEMMEQQHYLPQSVEEGTQPQEGAEGEGEEEEDVVFVMGKESEERKSTTASWAPREIVEQQSQS